MRKIWIFTVGLCTFAAGLLFGCRSVQEEKLAVLPYLPGNRYALYRFSDVLPHPVTGGAPDVLDGVKKSMVSLRNETLTFPGYYRQSRSRSAVLVSEFDSPAKGTMILGCGANRFLQVECNGKTVLDRWQQGTLGAPVSKYDHVLNVPVRKGHNVLVFRIANGSDGWSFAAGSIPDAVLPTQENLERLNDYFPSPGSQAHRLDALLMDNAVRQTRSGAVEAFSKDPGMEGKRLEEAYAGEPLLRVYDLALDRILDEIPAATPAPGEIAVWHLCGMGIVVKTSESCFAVDVRHRRAELLAPLLDALFLSHEKYADAPLLNAMTRAGKPVFSTFYRSGRLLHSPASFRLKDLQISTFDGADDGRKETETMFRIVCGRGADAPVLLHAGQNRRADLLRAAAPADLLIVSAAGAKEIPDMACTLSPAPALTVIAGLWSEESGARPHFSTETETVRRTLERENIRTVLPLWGEKLQFSAKGAKGKTDAAGLPHYRNALKAPCVLTGFPWHKDGEPLSRLPLAWTEKDLPDEVLAQARDTAGGVIRFRTDSPEIALKVMCGDRSGLAGNCAIDLYEEIRPGTDRLCGTLRSAGTSGNALLRGTLFRAPAAKMRSFAIHLPLSCPLKRLEIGLKGTGKLLPPLPRTQKKPIVFCGGAATQGGSASHPANSFTAILCRALDAPQINLGFRCGTQTAPLLAQQLAGLDPAAVVLEYDGNLPRETQERFFRILRTAHPELPILLIGDCRDSTGKHAADLRRIYEAALAKGDRRVRLIEGKELFSPYLPEDCCAGASEPTDLGFRLMSRRILPVLRSLLALPRRGN